MAKLLHQELQAMAQALAASILPHLGQPTTPPISWAQDGDTVTVVLADGRKVSASIQDINKIIFAQGKVGAGVPPAHDLVNLDQVDLVGAGVPPAQSKSKPAPRGGKGKGK